KVEARAAGDDLHLALGGTQLDLAAFGHFADDLEEGVGGDGRGAGLGDLGGDTLVDLQIEVGRHQPDRTVVARLDEDVGEDGNGVAALDHRLDVAQALQQGCPLDRRLHAALVPCPYRWPRQHGQGHASGRYNEPVARRQWEASGKDQLGFSTAST